MMLFKECFNWLWFLAVERKQLFLINSSQIEVPWYPCECFPFLIYLQKDWWYKSLYRVLYWKLKFDGWIMRVSFSVTLVLHRLLSQTWIEKLETCVTHLILKDLNYGRELDKFEKKVITFRHFFSKPNILLILVCDEIFQTWDAYVSLCWKGA